MRPGFSGQIGVADIQAHVRSFAAQGRISRYGVPERVEFVEALARTSVGKLNKRAMREERLGKTGGQG